MANSKQSLREPILLDQVDNLYVPQDERTLRRVQRTVEAIDRSTRGWAQTVIDLLPKGLSIAEDEVYILGLFLAQQRRLNMEMDSRNPTETLRDRISRIFPLVPPAEDLSVVLATAHRIVASRLDSDIDRACQFFCAERQIPHNAEVAIDWRVAIRYLAQELHHIACRIDLKKDYYGSPQRFYMALRTRDLSCEIVGRRAAMIAAYIAAEPEQQPVGER